MPLSLVLIRHPLINAKHLSPFPKETLEAIFYDDTSSSFERGKKKKKKNPNSSKIGEIGRIRYRARVGIAKDVLI